MYCIYCGKENADGAVTCAACGKPMVVLPADERTAAPAPEKAAAPAAEKAAAPTTEATPAMDALFAGLTTPAAPSGAGKLRGSLAPASGGTPAKEPASASDGPESPPEMPRPRLKASMSTPVVRESADVPPPVTAAAPPPAAPAAPAAPPPPVEASPSAAYSAAETPPASYIPVSPVYADAAPRRGSALDDIAFLPPEKKSGKKVGLIICAAALFLVLCGVIVFLLLRSQNTGTVTGTVLNAQSRQPLEGVTIEVIDPESDRVKERTKSDKNGEFSVRAPIGDLKVTLSKDAYAEQSWEVSALMKGEEYDLGECLLQPLATPDVYDSDNPPDAQTAPDAAAPEQPADQPAAVGWKEAYRSFVLDGGYRSAGQNYYTDKEIQFGLHDLNSDGTPELIITDGSVIYAQKGSYVFTYRDNAVTFIGAVGVYPECIHIAQGTDYPALFSFGGISGHYAYTYHSIVDGELNSETICLTDDTGGELTVECSTSDEKLFDACWVAFPDKNPDADMSVNALPLYTASQIQSMGWEAFTASF